MFALLACCLAPFGCLPGAQKKIRMHKGRSEPLRQSLIGEKWHRKRRSRAYVLSIWKKSSLTRGGRAVILLLRRMPGVRRLCLAWRPGLSTSRARAAETNEALEASRVTSAALRGRKANGPT